MHGRLVGLVVEAEDRRRARGLSEEVGGSVVSVAVMFLPLAEAPQGALGCNNNTRLLHYSRQEIHKIYMQ